MALTATEQAKIMNGEIKPSGAGSLQNLVHQTAVSLAINFYETAKDTSAVADATEKQRAESYKNKFYQVAQRVLKNDESTIKALTRIIVAILATKSFTYSQVSAAQDADWDTFVSNNCDEAIEFLWDIRKEEKTAYTAA